MPTTTDKASRVMMFNEKPNQYMTAKVGITDSGRATAEIQVARQSRRNSQTTNKASSAPSHNIVIDES
jgi:hypothetical protein